MDFVVSCLAERVDCRDRKGIGGHRPGQEQSAHRIPNHHPMNSFGGTIDSSYLLYLFFDSVKDTVYDLRRMVFGRLMDS